MFKTINAQKIMWIEIHIHRVKAKSQAGNMWVKDIMTILKKHKRPKLTENQLRILKIYPLCQKIQ